MQTPSAGYRLTAGVMAKGVRCPFIVHIALAIAPLYRDTHPRPPSLPLSVSLSSLRVSGFCLRGMRMPVRASVHPLCHQLACLVSKVSPTKEMTLLH